MKKPKTIENRWDILYRYFPRVYDEFTNVRYNKSWIDILRKMLDFKNKIVADIGSGSGKSTFQLAKYAKFVIGVEPENSMRKLAIENATIKKIQNVEFKKGFAESIPLKSNSVGMIVGITIASFYNPRNIRKFVNEAKRITKKGGYIVTVNVAPKWYGGDLAPVILGKGRKTKADTEGIVDNTLTDLGFKHKDYFTVQDYQTVDKAVGTYGFIFGRKAINYLKKHKKKTVKWKFRLHYKRV